MKAGGKVLRLTPDLALMRAARTFLAEPAVRCPKCDSTFIKREPAFIHCRHCGKLARIANVPLEVQELYELRSGLRIAS
jgi:ribosomal protein L37AE/L43A